MKSTNKGIVLISFVCAALAAGLWAPAYLHAEPDLLVYPDAPAEFRYDPAQFEAITSTHPNFDPAYQVGGVSLTKVPIPLNQY